ncbi:MAG TPA: hypothetical protein VGZ26_10530 [Pirellulales bacterium]|jgi:hypothetical protein|nr:hypothetical protein [Pirellulales bacterium]
MRKSIAVILLLAEFAAVALSATQLVATVIPPIGLAPGSQYQLIFVTNDSIQGVDSNIADYNTFVSSEAALGIPSGLPSGVAWHAVASTGDGAVANVNAPSGSLPVYSTSGVEVASGGIYGGSLLAPLLSNQYGTDLAAGGVAYSGSTPFGFPDNPLGGFNNPTFGRLGQVNGTWLDESNNINGFGFQNLYALSSPITFGTPEPATLTLLGWALFTIGGMRLLRRPRAA